jgi:heme oxygenase
VAVGLAAALHDGTKALHTEAERSGVMAALLRGQASRDAYVRLLASLHAIYDALETSLERHRTHAVLGPLYEPSFARRAALEADLAVAVGPDWSAHVPVPPLAQAYAAHLVTLAEAAPERLIAHAWLRYLGDLNGGQILARLVRAADALADIPTRFYEFPALSDPRGAAATWKSRLDALALDDATRHALVAEAVQGFERHIALFRAIADQLPATPSPSAA